MTPEQISGQIDSLLDSHGFEHAARWLIEHAAKEERTAWADEEDSPEDSPEDSRQRRAGRGQAKSKKKRGRRGPAS